jgi:hypothetical protein
VSDSLEREYRARKAVAPDAGDVTRVPGGRKSPLFRVFESRYYLWAATLTALGLVVAALVAAFIAW